MASSSSRPSRVHKDELELSPMLPERIWSRRTSESEDPLLPQNVDDSGTASATGASISSYVVPNRRGAAPRPRIRRLPSRDIIIPPDEDRIAKRELTGSQIFMITLNGTLGTGLYWGGGRILEIGGPVAACLSFLLVGLVSWMVMQCISEMLCIWPVPGALSVYVKTFVDEELGIAVGMAYWFTYSVSFSALISSTAEELGYWIREPWIQGVVFFFFLPVLLTAINWFPIKIYGRIEAFVGVNKIIIYIVIVIIMIAIGAGAGPALAPKGRSWASSESRFRFDPEVSSSWGTAFINCLSQASFAYVGIEIPAASALEARWGQSRSRDHDSQEDQDKKPLAAVSKSIRSTAMYFPLAIMLFYSFGILVVSLTVPSNHCDLPRMSYIRNFNCISDIGTTGHRGNQTSTSAFTVAARMSSIPHLDSVVNAFQVFTALFCASTNLYVASRTLFSLTCNIDGGPEQTAFRRFLAWFGHTNPRKVPVHAIFASAVAFSWVPLLQLTHSPAFLKSYGKFTEVLAGMGSVGVLIVWFCNVWAFLRFYYSTQEFRKSDPLRKFVEARRDDERYPFRSHQQPHLAWLTLLMISFLLVVANGAPIWIGFQSVPFLTAYLTIACFLILYTSLKLYWHSTWELVDLSRQSLLPRKFSC